MDVSEHTENFFLKMKKKRKSRMQAGEGSACGGGG